MPKSSANNRECHVRVVKLYKVDSKMTLTDLQNIAKRRGIAFGGLRKTQLIERINSRGL
jgi:hypothetical protein